MSSILTNPASLTAMANLASAQRDLVKFQNEASSGLAVATAGDNPAYWGSAAKMTSEVSALQAVSDALSQSRAIMDVTYSALNSVIDATKAIQTEIVAALQPGTDLNSIESNIAAYQKEIILVANSASFNGQNWLVDNWKVDNTETVSDSFSDTKSNVFAKENWNGSYTETTDEIDTNNATDSWGNIISGDNEVTSGDINKFSIKNNNDVEKTTAIPTVVTSSGTNPIVGQTIADIPVSYISNTGVLSAEIPEYNFKLFDNYVGTNISTTNVAYTDESYSSQVKTDKETSSYNSSVGLSYDPSLPDNGLGLLTESFNTTAAASSGDALPPSENLLTLNVEGLSNSDLKTALSLVNDVFNQVVNAASQLGASIGDLQTQQTFLSNSIDTLSLGTAALVDANMDLVSSRLSALRIQVQLGMQSLAIANSNSAIILKLFQ